MHACIHTHTHTHTHTQVYRQIYADVEQLGALQSLLRHFFDSAAAAFVFFDARGSDTLTTWDIQVRLICVCMDVCIHTHTSIHIHSYIQIYVYGALTTSPLGTSRCLSACLSACLPACLPTYLSDGLIQRAGRGAVVNDSDMQRRRPAEGAGQAPLLPHVGQRRGRGHCPPLVFSAGKQRRGEAGAP